MSIVTYFLGGFQGFLPNFAVSAASSAPVSILKFIAMVVFLARLTINLISVGYEDDTLYTYIIDIFKKELRKGGIFLELFSLTMVILSLILEENQVIGIIFFFSSLIRLISIRSNMRTLEIDFVDSMKKFYVFHLIRVVLFNLIFAHTIAISLLAIAKLDHQNNWIVTCLVSGGYIDAAQTWYMVYCWSFYWACTIMMTVGFGDIRAVDYREGFLIGFVEILSSMVLAYNLTELGIIIASMRKSSQELDRKLGVLRRMEGRSPVPQDLSCKIESYLTH